MPCARVLAVFTAKTVQQMLDAGGSQSWVLNQYNMRGVQYVVCVRNSDPRHDEECGLRHEPHNSAFMVGKVSGIRKIDRQNYRNRYIVEFSEYAVFEPVRDFRQGLTRNPVAYSDIDQCADQGLDIAALTFQPMPSPVADETGEPAAPPPSPEGMTLGEAKAGLAAMFGVPTDSIQITINA